MNASAYEYRGGIMLYHAGDPAPSPQPGELEALKAEAKRLGYTLKKHPQPWRNRKHLYSYAEPILAQHQELSPLLMVEKREVHDHAFVGLLNELFITPQEIQLLEQKLPAFLTQLELQEHMTVDAAYVFMDPKQQAQGMLLEWDGKSMVKTLHSPTETFGW